ncbi:MAG: DUF4153 domain-containing protein [Acutalibacteraceae bacterium]
MLKKTYPIKRSDLTALLFTVVFIFTTARLILFGGFNLGFSIGICSVIVTSTIYLFTKDCTDKIFCFLLFSGALVLSASFSVTNDFLIKFLTFVYIVFICATLFVTLSGNTSARGGTYSFIFDTVNKTFDAVLDNLMLPMRSAKESSKESKSKNILYLLVGVGISIPVICVVLPLLATSDIAFGILISKIFSNLFAFICAIVLTVIVTPFAYAFLFSMKKKDLKDMSAPTIPDKTPTVVINTILSTLTVVYIVYLFSQLAYISKAFAFLLPDGYSAAEFARSGFFQMAVIAFINFAILFLCSALVKKNENKKLPAFTKSLLIFLCVFTVFYISTAFIKMMKYISLYGLTRLRVLTSIFMIMLGVIFIIILLRLIFTKLKYIKAIILVCTLTMISVSVTDINTLIANYNYNQYKQGNIEIDVEQLNSLGVSALPVLVKLSEEKEEKVRYDAIDAIVYTAYDIYACGIENLDECTEENITKTNIFEKNYAWIQGEKALNEFTEKNPDFDYEEFYNIYYEKYAEYDEYTVW